MDELEKIRNEKLEKLKKSLQQEDPGPGPVNVTDSDIDDFIMNNRIAVVDCWAQWCGPCKVLSPVIDRLAEKYMGRVAFSKLNTDHNRSTSIKFGITSIPTLLVFREGELVDRIVGAVPERTIINRLEPLIQ
ncbi:thioredoxin [Methanosalsum zhilinae DSM 4017]|uniref:Thioredoxin n=1 Tax=Methanosalsum zhilinae (strain DSM 4017 / NBRC 107636 / OCM 62 / WeN5) TaxID=679901 RepID=F7XPC4_METZD|nr:thioredoxin [Methanosalsum zhilinae]AEH60251.1 thioredoxin [Methanosalsum zhilinae DSM 4017]